mmetsp:Transcript_1934/g.12091  ORF Transcript_1934/g.12091 Transcript_1934/m.12091 type:complete len:402 (-) Transcript_1934:1370-2575(-)
MQWRDRHAHGRTCRACTWSVEISMCIHPSLRWLFASLRSCSTPSGTASVPCAAPTWSSSHVTHVCTHASTFRFVSFRSRAWILVFLLLLRIAEPARPPCDVGVVPTPLRTIASPEPHVRFVATLRLRSAVATHQRHCTRSVRQPTRSEVRVRARDHVDATHGALRRKPRVLRRGTRSRRPPLPSAKGARALLSEVRARRGRGRREPGRGKSRRSRDVLAMVQSCGVAAAPAQLPLRADVFRVRRASVRHVRMDERRDHDDVEVGALPTVRRKRIRSSHVGEHAVRQMVARPRRRGGRSRRRASGCARRRNVRRHEPTRWWIRGWMTATLTVHVACTSSGGCGPAQKRGPVPRETTAGLEVDAACMEGPWRESLSTGGRVATWKEEPTGLPRAWTSAWKRVR